MKIFLFLAFVSFALISCFKSDNRELGVYNIADGYIRYQVNNAPFEINGGYSDFSNKGIGVYGRKQLKSASVPATRYLITGQLTNKRTINLFIITDSLKTGTYTTSTSTNAMSFAKIDTIQYAGNRPDDILNVNITRGVSGTIEGTFSGKLSVAKTANGSTTYTDGIITNGFFQNVVISY